MSINGKDLGATAEAKALKELLDKKPEVFEKLVESVKYLKENPGRTLIDYFGGNKEYTDFLKSYIEHRENLGWALKSNPILMSCAEKAVSLLKHSGKIGAAAGFLTALSGVASAATPEDRTAAIKEAGSAIVDMVDPSFGLVPYMLQEGSKNGKANIDAARTNPRNLAITRQQGFLFSPEHPDQLVALVLRDKPQANVQEMLRDPASRKDVFDEIAKRRAEATTPEGKDLFDRMAISARDFVELEGRRPKITSAEQLVQTKPQTQAMAAASPSI